MEQDTAKRADDVMLEAQKHLQELLEWRFDHALTSVTQFRELGLDARLVPEGTLNPDARTGEDFTLVIERHDANHGWGPYRQAPLRRFGLVAPGTVVEEREDGETFRWEIVGDFRWVAGNIVNPTNGDKLDLIVEAQF